MFPGHYQLFLGVQNWQNYKVLYFRGWGVWCVFWQTFGPYSGRHSERTEFLVVMITRLVDELIALVNHDAFFSQSYFGFLMDHRVKTFPSKEYQGTNGRSNYYCKGVGFIHQKFLCNNNCSYPGLWKLFYLGPCHGSPKHLFWTSEKVHRSILMLKYIFHIIISARPALWDFLNSKI